LPITGIHDRTIRHMMTHERSENVGQAYGRCAGAMYFEESTANIHPLFARLHRRSSTCWSLWNYRFSLIKLFPIFRPPVHFCERYLFPRRYLSHRHAASGVAGSWFSSRRAMCGLIRSICSMRTMTSCPGPRKWMYFCRCRRRELLGLRTIAHRTNQRLHLRFSDPRSEKQVHCFSIQKRKRNEAVFWNRSFGRSRNLRERPKHGSSSHLFLMHCVSWQQACTCEEIPA